MGEWVGGVEPALGDILGGVRPPDACEAVDGTRGDVDDLAACHRDLVENMGRRLRAAAAAAAAGHTDRPAQGDDVVVLDDLFCVRGRWEHAEPDEVR